MHIRPALRCRRHIALQLCLLDIHSLHIQRNVDPTRSRTPLPCKEECLLELVADSLWLHEHNRILRHVVANGRNNVRFLPADRTNLPAAPCNAERALRLSRQDNHRNGVLIRTNNTADCIERTRSARYTERRHLSMKPRIALCRHRRRLFVMLIDGRKGLMMSQ